jgi:CHAT domain-containing protein
VYPMLLSHRLAIVLELPDSNHPLLYAETLISRQTVEATLRQLRQDLAEPDRTPEAIAGLNQVYQWVIAPFNSVLTANPDIKTLAFVPDGELRNIPMAALFDGKQYLIANYAVAVAPRLDLFNPTPRSGKLKVFLGGIGEAQQLENRSFPRIENLLPELLTIQAIVDADPPLLDDAFTESNLEKQLENQPFSAIHLKTHGIFSSDPEETFIVAYRELLTGSDLGRLIQTGQVGTTAIELLVLSACSTAQGDNRAVLGLSGTAVQAGARSVISTLWDAQDLPNTQLMIHFYEALQNPTLSRSQALRQAQLYLINQGYRTPHIWATYALVGNWQ